MNKKDLLNFAKGMNTGAKSTIIIYYHVDENNEIVIEDTGFKENPKGTVPNCDFCYIKTGRCEFTPSEKDVYETWLKVELLKLKPK